MPGGLECSNGCTEWKGWGAGVYCRLQILSWRSPGIHGSVKPNQKGNLPEKFVLEQNYPNPFNPSTTIRYGLPQKSAVQLTIFNTLGQQVATIVQGEQEAGNHEVRFDGSNLSSGVYFYRLQAGEFVQTRKLLLLR